MRAPHPIGEPRAPLAVTAKTRKRCPGCNRMIEVGEVATLTDDRHMVDNISRNHGAAQYRAVRGAYHLWHPTCRDAFRQAVERIAREGR